MTHTNNDSPSVWSVHRYNTERLVSILVKSSHIEHSLKKKAAHTRQLLNGDKIFLSHRSDDLLREAGFLCQTPSNIDRLEF